MIDGFGKLFRIGLLVLALASPCSSVFGAYGIAEIVSESFDPDDVTETLEEATSPFTYVFSGLSAVLMIGFLGYSTIKAREIPDLSAKYAGAFIAISFITTLPFWRGEIIAAGESLADASGYTHEDVSERLEDMSMLWAIGGSPETESLSEPAEEEESAPFWKRTWAWVTDVNESINEAIMGVLLSGINGFLVKGVVLLVELNMAILVGLVKLAELLQRALIIGGSCLLPMFIASLGLGFMRDAAVRYIKMMFGLAMWPVAWALSNVLAVFFLERAITLVTSIANEVLEAATAVPPPGFGLVAAAASQMTWPTLIAVLAAIGVMVLYQVISLFVAPYAMMQAIAYGSSALSPTISAAFSMGAVGAGALISAGATAASAGTAAPAVAGATAATAGAGKGAVGGGIAAGGAMGGAAGGKAGISSVAKGVGIAGQVIQSIGGFNPASPASAARAMNSAMQSIRKSEK